MLSKKISFCLPFLFSKFCIDQYDQIFLPENDYGCDIFIVKELNEYLNSDQSDFDDSVVDNIDLPAFVDSLFINSMLSYENYSIKLNNKFFTPNIYKIIDRLNIKYEQTDDYLIFENYNLFDLYYIRDPKSSLLFNNLSSGKNVMIEGDVQIMDGYDIKPVIPSKCRGSDVGFDLSVVKYVKNFNSVCEFYDTGIRVKPPVGYYYEIYPRSSISKMGYMLGNSLGLIDGGYRGNLFIALNKIAPETESIKDILKNTGEPFKVCQLVLKKYHYSTLKEVKSLNATSRGSGGFGSTNV